MMTTNPTLEAGARAMYLTMIEREDIPDVWDDVPELREWWITAFAAGLAAMWQPISRAPRDGTTHFLAYEPTGDMYRAAYHGDGYLIAFCGQPVVQPPEPTHWMPLPRPPHTTGDAS